MPRIQKSLVRVNLQAREPGSLQYIQACKEFFLKMGGFRKIYEIMYITQEREEIPKPTIEDEGLRAM
jgi:hypothetical protein